MQHKQPVKKMLFYIAFCVVALTGCESAEENRIAEDLHRPPYKFEAVSVNAQNGNSASAPKAYTLSPGDMLDIKFFYTPELNETQAVRPDGQIALQIIGEVTAEGKTPAELRGLLKRLYAPHLKDPEISIIVRSFSNNRIFVGGQVLLPGPIDMSGQMTALEAIIQAGGIDYEDAEVKNIVVIRHHDGTRYGYLLNMEPMLEGKEAQPFFLEPKDIVYVPQTQIAKVNQWIDQHINKIIPQTGFIFSHRRGDTTIGIDTSSRY
ncbi:MAG: polysaccharide biosynthesis/export family protein [Planctomycetota bacterium]|jgi:protein involved in polysaccharide export with SLBB domain